jgi:phosphomannomutase
MWKGDQEWVLVIPHSDKPYFVVTVESQDPARAKTLLNTYVQMVEQWRDEK